MLDAILLTLTIVGWLGLVLGILIIVNTVCGIIYNTNALDESFSWKKLFKGLMKAMVFYISAAMLSVACTMLPYINEMITNAFGVILLSTELLNTLSSVGVLGVVVSSIVVQAKKAIEGVLRIGNIPSDVEIITWDVEDE